MAYDIGVRQLEEEVERLTFQRNKAQADAAMWEEVANEYRRALVRISDAESGHWGWIAHEALHPERAQSSEKEA